MKITFGIELEGFNQNLIKPESKRMDFEQARKIANKLENNLQILQNAEDFVSGTHEQEFKSEKYSANGVFSTLKESLIAYIECDSDKGKLEKLIQKMEEMAQSNTNGIFGGTLLNAANHLFLFNSGQKLVNYNSEADRILKEIDAQVNILCKEFSIELISGKYSGEYLPSDQNNLNRHSML